MILKKIVGAGAIAGALGFSAIGLAGLANADPTPLSGSGVVQQAHSVDWHGGGGHDGGGVAVACVAVAACAAVAAAVAGAAVAAVAAAVTGAAVAAAGKAAAAGTVLAGVARVGVDLAVAGAASPVSSSSHASEQLNFSGCLAEWIGKATIFGPSAGAATPNEWNQL